MSDAVKRESLWTYNKSKPRQIYKIIEVDFEGVVATTTINTFTDKEDSFSWFSPVEDFLQNFKPFTIK